HCCKSRHSRSTSADSRSEAVRHERETDRVAAHSERVGTSAILGVGVALGCGLLIGIERERRKGRGPARALAGVRTFALAAMLGVIAKAIDEPALIAAGALLV